MNIVGRGRVAKWSKEKIDKLSTPELRALLETEIAALCIEVLGARPRTGVVAPGKPAAAPRARRAKAKAAEAA